MMEKKYKIGYVPGVFDLFHVGHLNLINRCAQVSEYLIAGVLTDELVFHFKGKKPMIPFEQRYEIVKAIKGVDKVVAVDFSNTVKMDAWKLYHYDAYFSGSDHGSEWDRERKELQKVGSDIVFFPYTQKTSSTKIKLQLSQQEQLKRIYLFGAGRIGQRVAQSLLTEENKKKWKIEGFLDNSDEKYLTRVMGIPVYQPKDLQTLEPEKKVTVCIAMKAQEECLAQLEMLGYGACTEEYETILGDANQK